MSVLLITGGYDHSIKFWDIHGSVVKRSISYPDSQINKLTITPDKKYLGVAAYNTVKLYEISSINNKCVCSPLHLTPYSATNMKATN